MRLSRQFQASFFFFYEKILSAQKASKRKAKKFHPLRSFYMQKILTFVVFCLLFFVSKVVFGLICVFVRSKSFHKKKLA